MELKGPPADGSAWAAPCSVTRIVCILESRGAIRGSSNVDVERHDFGYRDNAQLHVADMLWILHDLPESSVVRCSSLLPAPDPSVGMRSKDRDLGWAIAPIEEWHRLMPQPDTDVD